MKFLPHIDKKAFQLAKDAGDYDLMYDILAQPLHQELYHRKTFEFMDDLSEIQQLLLAYDYVRTQVGQGGFIQFIQNGYISLLPQIIATRNNIGAPEMAKVLDDVLKVYVLNRKILDKHTTVQEFALLYDELKEFEMLDEGFHKHNPETIKKMLDYAGEHIDQLSA